MSIQNLDDEVQELAEILRKNRKVARSVVCRNEELERKLKKLGVDVRPRFTLSPPLGNATAIPFRQRTHHS